MNSLRCLIQSFIVWRRPNQNRSMWLRQSLCLCLAYASALRTMAALSVGSEQSKEELTDKASRYKHSHRSAGRSTQGLIDSTPSSGCSKLTLQVWKMGSDAGMGCPICQGPLPQKGAFSVLCAVLRSSTIYSEDCPASAGMRHLTKDADVEPLYHIISSINPKHTSLENIRGSNNRLSPRSQKLDRVCCHKDAPVHLLEAGVVVE